MSSDRLLGNMDTCWSTKPPPTCSSWTMPQSRFGRLIQPVFPVCFFDRRGPSPLSCITSGQSGYLSSRQDLDRAPRGREPYTISKHKPYTQNPKSFQVPEKHVSQSPKCPRPRIPQPSTLNSTPPSKRKNQVYIAVHLTRGIDHANVRTKDSGPALVSECFSRVSGFRVQGFGV